MLKLRGLTMSARGSGSDCGSGTGVALAADGARLKATVLPLLRGLFCVAGFALILMDVHSPDGGIWGTSNGRFVSLMDSVSSLCDYRSQEPFRAAQPGAIFYCFWSIFDCVFGSAGLALVCFIRRHALLQQLRGGLRDPEWHRRRQRTAAVSCVGWVYSGGAAGATRGTARPPSAR